MGIRCKSTVCKHSLKPETSTEEKGALHAGNASHDVRRGKWRESAGRASPPMHIAYVGVTHSSLSPVHS